MTLLENKIKTNGYRLSEYIFNIHQRRWSFMLTLLTFCPTSILGSILIQISVWFHVNWSASSYLFSRKMVLLVVPDWRKYEWMRIIQTRRFMVSLFRQINPNGFVIPFTDLFLFIRKRLDTTTMCRNANFVSIVRTHTHTRRAEEKHNFPFAMEIDKSQNMRTRRKKEDTSSRYIHTYYRYIRIHGSINWIGFRSLNRFSLHTYKAFNYYIFIYELNLCVYNTNFQLLQCNVASLCGQIILVYTNLV